MSHISGKLAAPLNSEFDKRPRMGLSDKELEELPYHNTVMPELQIE